MEVQRELLQAVSAVFTGRPGHLDGDPLPLLAKAFVPLKVLLLHKGHRHKTRLIQGEKRKNRKESNTLRK